MGDITDDETPDAADGEPRSRGARALPWVAGAAVIVVIALGVYLLWPRTPDHVLLVGDSVSYVSYTEITEAFGPDVKVEPITRPGYTSSQLLPLTVKAIDDREKSGEPLDRAIVLVGYNDAWTGNVQTQDLNTMVDEIARYQCSIWLTIPARPSGQHPGAGDFDPAHGEAWNDRVRTLVNEKKNIHLVDEWEKTVNDSEPGQYLIPDGIHPNDAGKAKLAEIMHDNLESACRFAR